MFAFTIGDVGSGKSIDGARKVIWCLDRSKHVQKKYKLPQRKQLCNFHISDEWHKKFPNQIIYWHNPMEMIFEDYPYCKIVRRDFDCHWDEIAAEIPSDKWKDTHLEIRRFFAQHRKRGIEIFANTQNYMMLDVNARRMATEVYEVKKFIGSRDISATLPPVKNPWGLIVKWKIDKKSIENDNINYKKDEIIPKLFLIKRELVDFYDTTEDISMSGVEDLKHFEKHCRVCGKTKVVHY